jgi:hypothetical protein
VWLYLLTVNHLLAHGGRLLGLTHLLISTQAELARGLEACAKALGRIGRVVCSKVLLWGRHVLELLL